MNKAIYMPRGAAGEYAKYACNFYKGCSNGCEYCYLKKGVLAHGLGGDRPTLKACFRDFEDAAEKYSTELCNIINTDADINKHGIFFTFTSDPCLRDTLDLNFSIMYATMYLFGIPVTMLTKRADWIDTEQGRYVLKRLCLNPEIKPLFNVGFTLTGMDDLEPNASTNTERIEAMRRIHNMGFRTWASVEPVIDIEASKRCIAATLGCCDEYRIGLLNGGKRGYTKEDVQKFVCWVENAVQRTKNKVYWKESVHKFIGTERSEY